MCLEPRTSCISAFYSTLELMLEFLTDVSHERCILCMLKKTWYSFFLLLTFFTNAAPQIIQYKS